MEEEFEKRGLHNWRNLFRKPTLQDWLIFFMLVMILFLAWAYQRDITVCKSSINFSVRDNILFQQPDLSTDMPKLNFSGLNNNVPAS